MSRENAHFHNNMHVGCECYTKENKQTWKKTPRKSLKLLHSVLTPNLKKQTFNHNVLNMWDKFTWLSELNSHG